MNTKISLFLLFIFLVLMLLFYYLKMESNVIILLGVVIVLLLNDLILNREHFSDTNEDLDQLLRNVTGTLNNLQKLKSDVGDVVEEELPYLVVKSSCAPSYAGVVETETISDVLPPVGVSDELRKINIPNLDTNGHNVDANTAESLSGIMDL
jgi:hypothetical protein